ncbi:MAG: IS6 family transposase [Dehalococcoidia bacterium]|nr:IS6 family transposase [Dehalococcoidia bacterium]
MRYTNEQIAFAFRQAESVLSELSVGGRIASFLNTRGDLHMSCPHCLSTSASKRKHRTSLGYRTYLCRGCGRRFNERTGSPFNDLRFPTDVVLLAVLWRLRYKLSFRDVAELLLQRGFVISHETIRAWEFRFAPMISDRFRIKRRSTAGVSWYLDETYIKVGGRWRYLYRAIDRAGSLLDSMLSEHRDKYAAHRFLRRLLDNAGGKQLRMTTDKHPAYTKAIRWIVGRKVLHRHNRYLNNRMEGSRAVSRPCCAVGPFVQPAPGPGPTNRKHINGNYSEGFSRMSLFIAHAG